MRPIKKIRFVDGDPSRLPVLEKTQLYRDLSHEYDFRISDHPDYLIDYGLGYHYLDYDCVKIFMTSENQVPDFNQFDYAMGFDDLTFGDRYLRLPHYVGYKEYAMLFDRKFPDDGSLLSRKFCSFVVSNSFGNPIRRKFFERLTKYKKVDSGGRYLNNVGAPVSDKLEFCRGYKFNIAFENSSALGYTTEKIAQAYAACSVPIYFGNPNVAADFLPDSMICVHDEGDIERAVEEVIRLDNDDAAYLAKCKAPCLVHQDPDYFNRQRIDFFRHIFDQPLDAARRVCDYGYQAVQRKWTKPALRTHEFLRDSFWFWFDLLHGKIRHPWK